jgi:hypothetical protein
MAHSSHTFTCPGGLSFFVTDWPLTKSGITAWYQSRYIAYQCLALAGGLSVNEVLYPQKTRILRDARWYAFREPPARVSGLKSPNNAIVQLRLRASDPAVLYSEEVQQRSSW